MSSVGDRELNILSNKMTNNNDVTVANMNLEPWDSEYFSKQVTKVLNIGLSTSFTISIMS